MNKPRLFSFFVYRRHSRDRFRIVYEISIILIIMIIVILIKNVHIYSSAFIRVGGFQAMVEKYPDALSSTLRNASQNGSDTCGMPRDDYMHLFRDPRK